MPKYWLLLATPLLVACGGAAFEPAPEGESEGVCAPCAGAFDCLSVCLCFDGDLTTCGNACGDAGSDLARNADDWTSELEALEDQVIELVNELRSIGGCCGDAGCFAPAPALLLDRSLRRAARLHGLDMGIAAYFGHDSPSGRSPFDRIRAAGFDGCALGENLAAGPLTADVVVISWVQSPEHCSNIFWPTFEFTGVGAHRDEQGLLIWVQTFGGSASTTADAP